MVFLETACQVRQCRRICQPGLSLGWTGCETNHPDEVVLLTARRARGLLAQQDEHTRVHPAES